MSCSSRQEREYTPLHMTALCALKLNYSNHLEADTVIPRVFVSAPEKQTVELNPGKQTDFKQN